MLRGELDRTRRELSECQGRASQGDDDLRSLVARRGDTLLQLARHYLPDISRTTIQKTFEEIRDELLAVLARREARQREVRRDLDDARKTIDLRVRTLDEVTARLNEKVARRELLEAEVAQSLKRNEHFQKRSVLALQAEEKLHRDEQRAADLASEASAKLPHYEKSRLFRYLIACGYGTPAYKAGGWTRSIDTWVAGLIDFANARNGYDFLKKTPPLVAEEVPRRREQFSGLMQQVEAIQKGEADRLGLTDVMKEGDALGTERDRLVAEIEALHAQAQATQKTLAELDENQNPFYAEAVEKLRAFLGETRVAILEQRARLTPEPDDDALVRDLARLAEDSESLRRQMDELARQRASLDRKQEGLDLLVRRYRQANFDSQRSFFEDGFDLGRGLDAFDNGQLDADRLWRSIQASQRFRPHAVDPPNGMGTQAIDNPAGRVLMGALIEVASAALQQAAVRGVQRRGDVFTPSWSPPDTSGSGSGSGGSPSPPPPPSNEGSFTSGEGF